MSRHADTDDSSNEGSGTDSEEDQKPDELSSRSENSSESDSGNETEETESRYMVTKNNDSGDKRTRDDLAAIEPATKKIKTLGGGARPVIPAKSDSQLKVLPANRTLATTKSPPVKKPVEAPKKPVEPQTAKKKEPEKADKEPPPKKTPQAWSSEDEIELISRILNDMKTGIRPPKRGSRGDNYHYWGDLLEACRGKFITEWSKEQLYDKYRRIKLRYDEMVKKERSEGMAALKFKNPGEENVYKLWKEIYQMQEHEEAEPPPVSKFDTSKKIRTPPPMKSKDDEEAKKDVASTSKKSSKPLVREVPKQNGSLSEQRPQQQQQHPASQGEKNLTVAALNELQKKSNAALSEMQGKIDEIMNEFQARSQGMVQEAVKGAGGKMEWLSDWLTLSMGRAGAPIFGMEMLGGIGSGGVLGWIGGPWDGSSLSSMKLKELFLKQQEDELRVMEQRVRLLQDLCRHQQELLKKQQGH